MTNIKSTLKSFCPKILHRLYSDTKFWVRFYFFRKGLISEEFRGLLGYDINWDVPQDLNEVINWQKLYYDTSEWTRLADKYLVRDYVRDRLGEEALPKIYGVWNDAESIDFTNLPKSFVLKTNHGCGTVLPVLDKDNIDLQDIRDKAKLWLSEKFGYRTIEPHYLNIKPVVYAEELLKNDSTESSSIIDYKLYCTNGKARCIMACMDRVIGEHPIFVFYDLDWNLKQDWLAPNLRSQIRVIERPKCLETLIEYAEKLAYGHPQVRTDFYIIDNKVIFGEMTFTSQGGYLDYISQDYLLELGKSVKL